MTRAMDSLGGDDHTVAVRINAPQRPTARPQAKPLHASTMRANAGVRFATGMDGVRRSVAAPQRLAPAPAVPAPVVELTPKIKGRWRQPVMVLGLVAITIVAGVASTILFGLPANSSASRPVVEAAAATPSATSVPTATPLPTASPTPLPTPSPTPVASTAQHILNVFAARHPGKFSIVVKNLTTGATASIDPNHQMTSASLYKLFVATQIYGRIDAGTLSYTDAAGGGSGRTISGCLTVMINISDNTCGRALGAILGWGAQNPALRAAGYINTNLATPQQTSAADVALLLETLYNNHLNSTNSNQQFMALLRAQKVNNRLPLGLPAGTVIAHKTGDLDGYMHDAGIVYGPKTNYLVVVMGQPGVTPSMFIDLSRQLWQLFE